MQFFLFFPTSLSILSRLNFQNFQSLCWLKSNILLTLSLALQVTSFSFTVCNCTVFSIDICISYTPFSVRVEKKERVQGSLQERFNLCAHTELTVINTGRSQSTENILGKELKVFLFCKTSRKSGLVCVLGFFFHHLFTIFNQNFHPKNFRDSFSHH